MFKNIRMTIAVMPYAYRLVKALTNAYGPKIVFGLLIGEYYFDVEFGLFGARVKMNIYEYAIFLCESKATFGFEKA